MERVACKNGGRQVRDILVSIYYKDTNSVTDNGLVCFTMKGESIEEVTQMLANAPSRQIIEIAGGYKILNMDNIAWLDVQYAPIEDTSSMVIEE